MSPKTTIILKPYLGARGMGQVKIKRSELRQTLDDAWQEKKEHEKKLKENENNKDNLDWG